MAQRILVVDDEESIATLLQFNLEQSGFEVTVASDGEEGLALAKDEPFDLLILDLMLPKIDGLDICKQLRQNKKMTPILMLTAKDDEFDKVLGLELGADDYMTKPFSPREVVARVRAILRRSAQLSETSEAANNEENGRVIKIGDVEIFPENYEVLVHKKALELTPKEFELFLYLANHKGRVLTRDQLLNAVWNYEFVGDTRIVDVHISHLREKIEPNTKKPVYIKTVRGLGYKLEEPQLHA
ncbi:two-component response regulator involved in phosphate regulation [Alkalihalophilus pseudofirmus OF4]|jgi:two-component system alkaline phosphatase synthesis response regulator PhoP|uniref:Two-component response regulator involved in phosphate regulation n=2 Tax=Alkalihalophilus TaxID=2893060 RepID=D3FWY1_ALKPO|nr:MULTISPECIES: response regulator transcription factor [Alkalihalophilus]ADC48736.1 two-component response regulator involved in phosphate regulation [Alkalihalophilus pseudofirmus OF4]ERN52515.1 PhoP family transcriptional regulator [Alkalihalophilus marmarensis DSM 21297]MCM3487792.1 response regulator transcription factor [Alkalihalophilus marmarensis]